MEFEQQEGMDTDLVDFIIPFNSAAAGKTIIELRLPQDSLITLVCRDEDFLVPAGSTTLEEGDVVLVLVNKENLPEIRSILLKQKPRQGVTPL